MGIPIAVLARLIIAIIAIAPVVLLLRRYHDTKFPEFLIFALFFLFGAIHHALSYVAFYIRELWAFQLFYIFSFTSFLFLLLHSHQIMRKSLANPLLVIGVIWYLAIMIALAFWQVETQPDVAEVLFIEMLATDSLFHPDGASTYVFGTMILGTSYRILSLSFDIYVCAVGFFAYLTVDISANEQDIEQTRFIWIVSFILLIIYLILVLPGMELIIFETKIEPALFIVAGLLGVIFLVIRRPESFFLSREQIIKAHTMYKSVDAENDVNSLIDDRLRRYIHSAVEQIQKAEKEL